MGGVATGVKAGTATITASFMGATGMATLTVTAGTLTSIQVSPVDPTVGVNTAIAFTATGIYSDGTRADITQHGDVVELGDRGGLDQRRRPRAGARRAARRRSPRRWGPDRHQHGHGHGGDAGSIAVTPATSTLVVGGTVALHATGTYSDGTMVDLTSSVVWTSSAPTTASVSMPPGRPAR